MAQIFYRHEEDSDRPILLTPELAQRFTYNLPVGCHGDIDFIVYNVTEPDAAIDRIKISRVDEGGPHVVLAIEVEFQDGTSTTIGDFIGEPIAGRLEPLDRFTHFNIHAGDRVDGISWKSIHDPKGTTLGGGRGDQHQQNIGNGRLAGFYGKILSGQSSGSRWDTIGSLAALFYK